MSLLLTRPRFMLPTSKTANSSCKRLESISVDILVALDNDTAGNPAYKHLAPNHQAEFPGDGVKPPTAPITTHTKEAFIKLRADAVAHHPEIHLEVLDSASTVDDKQNKATVWLRGFLTSYESPDMMTREMCFRSLTVIKSPKTINPDDCCRPRLTCSSTSSKTSAKTVAEQFYLLRVDVRPPFGGLSFDIVHQWAYDDLAIVSPTDTLPIAEEGGLTRPFIQNNIIFPLLLSKPPPRRCRASHDPVRGHIDVHAWNRRAVASLPAILAPKIASLVTPGIATVAMKKEVGYEEVVAGAEIHIPECERRVRVRLRLIDGGQYQQCQIVPFAVPYFEVASCFDKFPPACRGQRDRSNRLLVEIAIAV
ncbi:hypothetical protein M409DRAFT_55887 [Zasmidium cellare ATCC 36951]|uniref:Uncharacterized protein n=1 Tax=Zasmidium cellare ATCC 36951 TaxID=1080233 RepID=A0A6A6CJB3_ZASCE|nr:uncharacterized protein M409DRAFT_55887 [Zasmidium cellare ATCC 36951]KAF2165506.1 hypothetical protein M409DRAFT_55887 [Zasmidium cellare ATCC 36951]